MMPDNSPAAQLRILRQARSGHLRAATDALDARQAALARLATIDAEIESYEADERSRNRRRRIAHQKLANAHYRDGTLKDQPGHLEIVRRYAWTQTARRAPLRRGSKSLVALLRLRELERLWSVRYSGVLPNDDAGEDDLWIAAQLIRRRQGNISEKVVAWARVWAPWCSTQEAASLAAHVVSHPYEFSADMLAEKIGLTYVERQSLGITTIGAVDADPAERERLRRQRSRANEKRKRRANGVKPREQYELFSNEALRPWEDKGISRATWYRRRRAARVDEGFRGFCDGKKGDGEGFATVSGPNGSLQGPNGSLLPGSVGEGTEKCASEPREIGERSAGSERAKAVANTCISPGSGLAAAPPVLSPSCGHARSAYVQSPPRALPSELRRGLSVAQNIALRARSEPRPSNEERAFAESEFQGWSNCLVCGAGFRPRRGRQVFFCDDCCSRARS